MFRILSRSARNAVSKEQALRKVRPMEEKKPGRHNLLQEKAVCSGPGKNEEENTTTSSSFSYLFRMIFFVICLYAILTKVNETLREVAKTEHFYSIRNPKFTLHN